MKRLLILPVLLLTLLVETPAFSADGYTAYLSDDFATALREWTPLAEEGDASAQFNLGVMYDQGQGVPEDKKTAVKWYTLSAEQGDADAESILTSLAKQGDVDALYALTSLAEKGDASAQSNLGWMYLKGYGVPQDNKTALKWYTFAAEQGFPAAQWHLGQMYYNGHVVPEDHKIAIKWYTLAAEQGHKYARGFRDWMYDNGTVEFETGGCPKGTVEDMGTGKCVEDNCPKRTEKDIKSNICIYSYTKNEYRDYIPCNDLVRRNAIHPAGYKVALFKNGIIPECKNEQFPNEWIEHKQTINKIGITECGIRCNIRQFPLIGNISGNIIATVEGNEEIFLETLITTIPYGTTSPWYLHWYSFSYKGKTAYIWKGSIQE
jgi:uncharacterized protein